MPIYEYECKKCGHQMEALQRMSDDALKDCPECQAPALKKLISAAGFRLSGSGWYETDFKSGQKKNLVAQDSKAGTSGAGADASANKSKATNAAKSASK